MPKMQLHLSVEMDTGRQHEVVADQRDYARLEVQPFAEAGIHTRMRFLAWSVLTREGKITAGWDAFNGADCVEVESLEVDAPDDSEGGQGLDPGRKSRGAGS